MTGWRGWGRGKSKRKFEIRAGSTDELGNHIDERGRAAGSRNFVSEAHPRAATTVDAAAGGRWARAHHLQRGQRRGRNFGIYAGGSAVWLRAVVVVDSHDHRAVCH